MAVSLEDIVKKIGSLPPLPNIAMKLISLLNNPNTKVSDLTEIISKDQALTADILKIVNSPFYGLRKEIVSIKQAINYLGFLNLKSLLLAINTKKFIQSGDLKDLILWKHSLATGLFSKYVGEKLKVYNPEELFVAGLLHDIGKTVLRRKIPHVYDQILDEVYSTGKMFEEIEKAILDFTHSDVGMLLVQEWNFGDRMKNIIFYHHHPDLAENFPQETAVVYLGDQLSNFNGYGFYRDFKVSHNEGVLNILNVDEEKIVELNEEFKPKVENEVSAFL